MLDLPIYPSFHPATVRQGLSFEERAELAGDAGFHATALDVTGALDYDRAHGPGKAAALLRSRGLEPGGWGAGVGIFSSEEDFERGLSNLEGHARFASELGATKCMAFVPNRSDNPMVETMKLVAGRIRVICEVLARHGAALAIEFCGPNLFPERPHGFMTGVDGAMKMAAASGAGNVGVLVDSFHLFCAPGRPEDIPRHAQGRVYGAHINDSPSDEITRLKDPDRVMPGDGVIPLADFIKGLHAAGYRGPMEVELFNEAIRKRDPLEVAKEARTKTERILEAAFSG